MKKVWHVKTKELYNDLVATLLERGHVFNDFTSGWFFFEDKTCIALDENEGEVDNNHIDYYKNQGLDVEEYTIGSLFEEYEVLDDCCEYCGQDDGLEIIREFRGDKVALYKKSGDWYLAHYDSEFYGWEAKKIDVNHCLECGKKQ